MSKDLTDEQILQMVDIMNNTQSPTTIPLSKGATQTINEYLQDAYKQGKLDLIKELKEQKRKLVDYDLKGNKILVEAIPLSVLEAKIKELNET